MSDPKDHLDPAGPADPMQATEAKLCAYLEGELDPAERAEIEQHLAANPQHRHLLADLAQTRDWMRSIPMESSPIDLADVFQGQVERTMLLDESSETGSGFLLRWPQFVMVAAIVTLMLGLGVLITVMLRGPKPGDGKTFSLAPRSPSTGLSEDRNGLESSADKATGVASDSPRTVDLKNLPPAAAIAPDSLSTNAAMKRAVPSMARAAVPMPTVPAPADGTPIPGSSNEASAQKTLVNADAVVPMVTAPSASMLRDREAESVDGDSLKQKLLAAGYHVPVDQKTVCFVVSADAPAATIDQVRGFFGRHDLAFDNALTGEHQLGQSALAYGNNPANANHPSIAFPGQADVQSTGQNSVQNAGQNSSQNQGQVPSTQQMVLNVSPGNPSNYAANNEQVGSSPSAQLNQVESNGASRKQQLQPNSVRANADEANAAKPEAPNINAMVATPALAGKVAKDNRAVAPLPISDETIYVAHGLTELQMNLLSASLATSSFNQSVRQLTLADAPVLKKSDVTAGLLNKGQILTITVAQLVGPGIDKTTVVKISDEGTVSLPMIDPVLAAGLSPEELQQHIAGKYREANLIPDATVTVNLGTALPATTGPTTMPSAMPATSPAKAMITKPVGIEVLVLIEKNNRTSPGK